jgi:hypothetical protein
MVIQNIKDSYKIALDIAKNYKNLIIFLALTNIVFFFFGQWMVAQELPGVIEFRKEVLKNLPELFYLKPITGPLAPYIILKIIYTFIFNLTVGAFLTTTAPGAIFFLPYIISVLRAWSIGVIFYGLLSNPIMVIAFYGTFILEFGAYILSAAAGIDIGLSILMPSRKGKIKRKDAFRAALNDSFSLYLLIATLLLLGAIWEMGWLHFASLQAAENLTLTNSLDML